MPSPKSPSVHKAPALTFGALIGVAMVLRTHARRVIGPSYYWQRAVAAFRLPDTHYGEHRMEWTMAKTRIAVVFGSDSDWPVMRKCVEQLDAFGEHAFIEVMSAHRTPQRVQEFAEQAHRDGVEVIIAGAGMSAALAGSIAAHTTLPVVGVPLASGALQGVDALLSTVQMPPGIPVACVGIGAAGAKNAALLAIQIIARHDEKLDAAYRDFKREQAKQVQAKNRALLDELGQ